MGLFDFFRKKKSENSDQSASASPVYPASENENEAAEVNGFSPETSSGASFDGGSGADGGSGGGDGGGV